MTMRPVIHPSEKHHRSSNVSTARLLVAGIVGAASVFALSCSPSRVALGPHSIYNDQDYYWQSGTAILVSVADHTQAALSARRLGDEVDLTLYVRNASDSRFEVDAKDVHVTAVYEDESGLIDRNSPCLGEPVQFSLNEGQSLPVTVPLKVFSGGEYIEKTRSEFLVQNILSAVASGLHTASYESETARAIGMHGETDRMKDSVTTQQQLLSELRKGLYKRHTLFPSTSYMGSIKCTFDRRTTRRTFSPYHKDPTDAKFYQVCVKTGPDEHLFLIQESLD